MGVVLKTSFIVVRTTVCSKRFGLWNPFANLIQPLLHKERSIVVLRFKRFTMLLYGALMLHLFAYFALHSPKSELFVKKRA